MNDPQATAGNQPPSTASTHAPVSTAIAATAAPLDAPAAKKPAAPKPAAKKSVAAKPPATKSVPAKRVRETEVKPVTQAATRSAARTKPAAVAAPVPVKTAAKRADKKAAATKPVAKAPSKTPKLAKKVEAAPAPKQARSLELAAKPKEKLVRDSFTMPQADFALIASLKNRALLLKRPTRKSELLRAGLHALQALTSTQLMSALNALVPLKAGRPKRDAD